MQASAARMAHSNSTSNMTHKMKITGGKKNEVNNKTLSDLRKSL
jgi:hypothetical protein